MTVVDDQKLAAAGGGEGTGGAAGVAEMIRSMGVRARAAARQLAAMSGEKKNLALHKIADGLLAGQTKLIEANARDSEQAKTDGLAGPLVARLMLGEK